MKQKNKLIALLIIVSIQLSAQSNIRFNNFWDNLYTINPASINDSYLGEVSMGTRKQWVNFPGAPTTIFAAGTIFVEDLNTQFGLKVLADKIGYTSITDIDASYAHAILLNTEWQLNLGISASFQSFGYDASKVSFPIQNDPVYYDKLISDRNFNTDFGFELSHRRWRFGGSSQNFLTLFEGMKINKLHENTNILYAMYKDNDNDFINLGGGVSGFQTKDLFQTEFNLSAFFKKTNENNAFQIGAFYRTWHEMGVLAGIHFDKLRIFYSYDFNVGQIYRKSLGSHEIILAYKFNKTYKCKNCWY